jgi:hypothetical protein
MQIDYGEIVDDNSARGFFERLLAGKLSTDQFEVCVMQLWQLKSPCIRAPSSAKWLRSLALEIGAKDAGYGHDSSELFSSRWLAGCLGRPGAIHIAAEAERREQSGLNGLNRPLHCHDSGRIGLLTKGNAVFHFVSERRLHSWSLSAGDLVAWPAWTAHTFDAGEGFSLVSAMAEYVSPSADGFSFPPDDMSSVFAEGATLT